jgi:hypothetical protein
MSQYQSETVSPSTTGLPRAHINGFAIAGLVTALTGFWGLNGVLGLVFGYIARAQIDRSGGTETGRGLAIAAIILGWIGVVFFLFMTVVVLFGLTSGLPE